MNTYHLNVCLFFSILKKEEIQKKKENNKIKIYNMCWRRQIRNFVTFSAKWQYLTKPSQIESNVSLSDFFCLATTCNPNIYCLSAKCYKWKYTIRSRVFRLFEHLGIWHMHMQCHCKSLEPKRRNKKRIANARRIMQVETILLIIIISHLVYGFCICRFSLFLSMTLLPTDSSVVIYYIYPHSL